jgi:2-hydroxy-3-keto-5-methylthiopentenyl-1-phosphate phosphatase
MSDLIRQSVEQMRANAIKRTEDKLEQQKRYELYQEQENRKINQQQQFAKHIDKIQKQEDKIVKNVLSIDQSYDEFNKMMTTYNSFIDNFVIKTGDAVGVKGGLRSLEQGQKTRTTRTLNVPSK